MDGETGQQIGDGVKKGRGGGEGVRGGCVECVKIHFSSLLSICGQDSKNRPFFYKFFP